MPATIEWQPHRYRDVTTGEMAEDPSVQHADNGRQIDAPGYFVASVVPYGGSFQIIALAPSWPKPYYTRAWKDRAVATARAERLIRLSLQRDVDMIRDGLHELVAHDDKAIKGPGYQPPDITAALRGGP